MLQSSAPGTPLLPHASLGLVLLSLPLAWAIAARRSVPSGFLGIGSWGMTLPRPGPHPQPWAAVPLLCGPLGLPLTRSRGAMGENAYFEGSICGLCSSPSASIKPANVNVRISFSQRLKGFVLICSFGYTCSESHDLLELLLPSPSHRLQVTWGRLGCRSQMPCLARRADIQSVLKLVDSRSCLPLAALPFLPSRRLRVFFYI